MTQITDQIWLGSHLSAAFPEHLRKEGINCILNCANDLAPALDCNKGFNHFHCGMRDHVNHRSLYEAAVRILEGVLHNPENRVLVHCYAGISRSPFVVACYLVYKGKFSLISDAEKWLRSKRDVVRIHEAHYRSYHPLDERVRVRQINFTDDEL